MNLRLARRKIARQARRTFYNVFFMPVFSENENQFKTFKNGIPSVELAGKRVLLRLDLNLPMGENKMIDSNEEWRIIAALPTIKYLIAQNAKVIILSHLGRPKTSRKFIKSIKPKVRKAESSEYSLRPAANRMGELLKIKIKFVDDCIGDKVKKAAGEMNSSEIILLENLRFYEEEERNNEKFAKALASFGDIYVNDAFSDCHRNHSSIVGITKFLPSYAGLLLEKEIQTMEKFYSPKHPAVAVIGGAKLETKLPAVQALAKIYDYVLVGGIIANEMIKPKFMNSLAPNIILPAKENLIKEKYLDIGHNTVKEFSKFFKKTKTIIWNGPMGMFEDSKYQAGTKGIVELIKSAHKKGAAVLIGGGETIYALQKFAPELMDKKIKNFNISTGGGAMLEFLAGKKLPGIEAL